jgi:hypothetical protein
VKYGFATGIVFLMMFAGPARVHANDYSMNKECLKAYDLILQLKLDQARKVLQSAKSLNPANNIVPYLENYSDFLEIIITEEESIFNSHSTSRKKRLELLGKGNEKSPWHLYCQAQVNMQWAFARIKFGGYGTAALELNRSYRLLIRNKELFPDFRPNDAALGLLHVLIGSVPENYKWVAQTFSFHGTVSQGIGELQQIFANPVTLVKYPFLKSESLFLLGFITFNFSSSSEDFKLFQHLLESPVNKTLISGSPLLIYAASSYFLHNGMNSQALNLLLNRPKGKEYFPFYYLEYLTGIAKLNKLDKDAKLHFLRFVVNFKGRNFIKSAYLRLAWIELMDNNPGGYITYMESVKLMGSDDIDGDKQAMTEAGYSVPPDIILLNARLLFDGGYYNEALSELKRFNPLKKESPREKLEFKYRLARIYHKSGNKTKAILFYQETLDMGAAYPYYFAANASLQLGIINESSGNKVKAGYYYQKCLDMKYTEYRTSIGQKAKAGLSRVK